MAELSAAVPEPVMLGLDREAVVLLGAALAPQRDPLEEPLVAHAVRDVQGLGDIMLNPGGGMKPIRMIMAGSGLPARARSRTLGRLPNPRSEFGLRRRGERGILSLAPPSRQLQRTLESIES